MHDSRKVANRFLELARAQDDTVTPMQLLKLVYIAHGWMLGLYGRGLIQDEVQAWQYGPVIPHLYNATRQFRSQPVEGPLPTADSAPFTAAEDDVIRQTYDIYGKMTGPALSRLTHAPETPWRRAFEFGRYNVPISNDIIEDHYATLAKAS